MTNRLEAVNGVWRSVQPAAGPAAKQAEAVPLAARLIARLAAMKGAGRYLTVPNLRMRESDVEAAGRMFGGSARSADPSKYATWLNRILNRGNLTADVLVDKGTPLLHNPRFIIDRLSRTGWMASPDALRRAGVVQVNAAPVRSLDGGPLVATPAEMQAFRDGIFPFRSMYGRLAVAKDAAGKPIYVPWRISNHVNTATPVRVFSGQSGAGSYYDVVPGAASGVDPRLLTYKGSSRGSFDLFVPQGGETGIRFDWQEPYGAVGYYGGPRLGGPRDWGGVVYGSGPLGKRAEARGRPTREGGGARLRRLLDKCAECRMTKEARNILRLLSRVGPDLAGATSQDLKFLARRGLKGLTPEQCSALIERGLLPNAQRVLFGAARGTMAMLRNPLGVRAVPPRGPASAAKKTFNDDPAAVFSSSSLTRRVVIPTPVPNAQEGLVAAIARQGTARHEAREFVRGSVLRARQSPTPEDLAAEQETIRQVGSSHHPGVLHDERVFKSQLANRLGLDMRWEDMPIFGGKYRSLRDIATGKRPLAFDFRLKANAAKMRALRQQLDAAGKPYPASDEEWAKALGIRPIDVFDVDIMSRLSPYSRSWLGVAGVS